MDREKQIEEMARIMSANCGALKDCEGCKFEGTSTDAIECFDLFSASSLYNAGYRKQSEGEWIRKDGFFVCSNCDRTKPFAVIRDEIHYYGCNYCPNCGAHMSGGKTDE